MNQSPPTARTRRLPSTQPHRHLYTTLLVITIFLLLTLWLWLTNNNTNTTSIVISWDIAPPAAPPTPPLVVCRPPTE